MKTFLIDDDELSTFLTQNVLLLEGVTKDIETFFSAREAINILRICPDDQIPKLILLDLNMPEMDGWQFLDALMPIADKLIGRCSVYILTSSLDQADKQKAKEYALITGILHKPIAPQDISILKTLSQKKP